MLEELNTLRLYVQDLNYCFIIRFNLFSVITVTFLNYHQITQNIKILASSRLSDLKSNQKITYRLLIILD